MSPNGMIQSRLDLDRSGPKPQSTTTDSALPTCHSTNDSDVDKSSSNDDLNQERSSFKDDEHHHPVKNDADAEEASRALRHATVYGKERQDLLDMVDRKLLLQKKKNDVVVEMGRNDTEQKSNDQADLILVSGVSGSGKSTLARSLKEIVDKRGGCFLSGKVDQFRTPQQSTPLVTAVSEAASSIMVDSGDDRFRDDVEEEFGNDLSVLLKVMPTLSPIFHRSHCCHIPSSFRQPPEVRVDRQEAGDAKARFRRIYCRLLGVICKQQRSDGPVILFLDDLQWANSETLDLLTEVLMSDQILRNLVVVAASRPVTQDHELCKYLRQLDENGLVIQDIVLSNLPLEVHTQHLSYILGMDVTDGEVQKLSEMLYPYTGGNFFSIRQVLGLLLDEGLLTHTRQERRRWIWDEDEIRSHLYCDDIVQFVVERLKAQCSISRDVLAVASCLGSSFDLQTVEASRSSSTFQKVNLEELMLDLENKTFLIRHGNNWSFAHDRVQQAAYSLISEERRSAFHLEIGRRQLRNFSSDEVDLKLLLIASQIHRGIALVTQPDEKRALSEFFLRAGKKAAQLSQFDDASRLYGVGLSLLPPTNERWRSSSSYDLCLELYNASAEVEYVRANFDRITELLDTVLSNARSFSDKLRSYTTMIYALGTQNKLQKAIEIGRMVLRELKEPLPKRTSMRSILMEYYRTRYMFSRMSEEDFLHWPSMSDPTKLAAVRIMTLIVSYLYWTGGPLTAYLSIRVVQLSIKYGISHMTAVGLAFYGGLVCTLGAIDHGRTLGMLALKIVNRSNVREWKCRVITICANNVLLWSSPIRNLPKSLQKATRLGLDTGDIEFALLSAGLELMVRIDQRYDIRATLTAWRHVLGMMERHRQTALQTLFSVGAQASANLAGEGKGDSPLVLTGEFMNEREAVQEALAADNCRALGMVYTMRAFIAAMLGQFEDSRRAFYTLRKHTTLEEFLHPTIITFHDLFEGLGALLCRSPPSARRRKYRKAKRCLKRLKKMAFHAPYSDLAKAFLLEGEIAAQRGLFNQAMMKFEASVGVAQKEDATSIHAMVLERQSALVEGAGRQEEAMRYLRRAREIYNEWGCDVKVIQLDEVLAEKVVASSSQRTTLHSFSTIAQDLFSDDTVPFKKESIQ